MKRSIGSYPRVRVRAGVQDDGRQVVSRAGSVLLVETVRKTGLDQAISQALAPWRKPRAVHDPGKALLDVALAVALGGDCLADVAMLRCGRAVFGPVASDPTVSRLIDTLAASGEKALQAIRSARSASHLFLRYQIRATRATAAAPRIPATFADAPDKDILMTVPTHTDTATVPEKNSPACRGPGSSDAMTISLSRAAALLVAAVVKSQHWCAPWTAPARPPPKAPTSAPGAQPVSAPAIQPVIPPSSALCKLFFPTHLPQFQNPRGVGTAVETPVMFSVGASMCWWIVFPLIVHVTLYRFP